MTYILKSDLKSYDVCIKIETMIEIHLPHNNLCGLYIQISNIVYVTEWPSFRKCMQVSALYDKEHQTTTRHSITI